MNKHFVRVIMRCVAVMLVCVNVLAVPETMSASVFAQYDAESVLKREVLTQKQFKAAVTDVGVGEVTINAKKSYHADNAIVALNTLYVNKGASVRLERGFVNELYVYDEGSTITLGSGCYVESLHILAKNCKVKIGKGSTVKTCEVYEGYAYDMQVDGVLKYLSLNDAGVITLKGSTTKPVRLRCAIDDGQTTGIVPHVATYIPVKLFAEYDTGLILEKGAEDSVIYSVGSMTRVYGITNNTTADIPIIDIDDTTTYLKSGESIVGIED